MQTTHDRRAQGKANGTRDRSINLPTPVVNRHPRDMLRLVAGHSSVARAFTDACLAYVSKDMVKSVEGSGPLVAYACAKAVQMRETQHLIRRITVLDEEYRKHVNAITFDASMLSDNEEEYIRKNMGQLMLDFAEIYNLFREEGLGLVSPGSIISRFGTFPVHSVSVLGEMQSARFDLSETIALPHVKKELDMSHGTVSNPILKVSTFPNPGSKCAIIQLEMNYTEERRLRRPNGSVFMSRRTNELVLEPPQLMEGNVYYLGRSVSGEGCIPITDLLPRSNQMHAALADRQFLLYVEKGKVVVADIGQTTMFRKIQ